MTQKQSNSWFFKLKLPYKILICLILWPFIVPILVWPLIKDKTVKTVALGIWVIFVLCVLVIALVGPQESSPEDYRVAKTKETETVEVPKTAPVEQQTPTPVVQATPEPTPAAPLTPEDTVKKAIPEGCKGCESKLISPEYAALSVNIDENTYWNETAMLESMLEDFINYGDLVKDVPGVKFISVFYNGVLIDDKGNSKPGNIMFIELEVEKFKEYTFSNLAANRIYNSLASEATISIIPSTRQKINFEKVNVRL